jgi:hypothetical protein
VSRIRAKTSCADTLQERRARMIAKASRSTGALSARPSLTPKDTGSSMHSMKPLSDSRRNPTKPSMFDDGMTAVPAPIVAYDSRGENAGSPKSTRRTPAAADAQASPKSPNSSSRRHRHERSLSKEPAPLAPVALAPVVQATTHRYQPARPSPLALAAKSQTPTTDGRPTIVSPTSSSRSRNGSLTASEIKAAERKPDETVPKWGQKPFRSAGTTHSEPTSPTGDINADSAPGGYPDENSEDDDPFEHAKYDRHRSTASTHVSSVDGRITKRDTVRQSRDRDVMGGIAEWQEEMAVGREQSHQRGLSYPYPPQQYTSQQYQDDGATPRGNDPFYGNEYRNDAYR